MARVIHTLRNGIRVLTVAMPQLHSVTVAAFVNTGSRNESLKQSGISHFLEHMAFKGTKRRNYKQISGDVERLGADVNAYTSHDRTVYWVSGLARDLPIFVDLIGDILLHSELPEDEIENERNVIIQEINTGEDDADVLAAELADAVAYPDQAYGRSVIGLKSNILNFQRSDFTSYMASQYTGANVIVGIAGNMDPDKALRLTEEHFGDLASGDVNSVPAPKWVGGVGVNRKASFTQTSIHLAFPGATAMGDYHADLIAASVLGEGASSPLNDEIREKRGLVYHVDSYFGNDEHTGMFTLEANTSGGNLDEFFNITCDLLKAHTETVADIDLERAINMQSVTAIRALEKPFRSLENAVEDLFTYGAIKSTKEFLDALAAVTKRQVKDSIGRLISQPPSLALVGGEVDEKYLQLVTERLR